VQNELRLRQHRQQGVITIAPFAAGIEVLARRFLLALAAKYHQIQIKREAALGSLH